MTNSKNKIALLYDCPYPFVQGGGQKRLFEIATRLVKKGWQVDWYALKFWEGADCIEQQGINYIAVGKSVPLYKANGKRSLKEALYYGWCFLSKICLRRYDIIHAGQWPYFHLYPARLYALLGGSKLTIDWWETWGDHWHEYAGKMAHIGRALEWISSRLPVGLVAISEQGRQDLIQLGLNSRKIQVIHNGIDYKWLKNIQPEARAYDFVYMGRLAPHKNIDHLLQAMAFLVQAGMQPKLEIIGDGPERSRLEEMVKTLKLDANIKFHGTIVDPQKAFSMLKAASYFVHPSTKEGGGSITTLEANACGLPVIAYRHPNGIAEELITEGVNGYWVDEVNPQKLAEKLAQLLNQQPLPKEPILVKAQDFDWEKIANQYHGYFQTLVRTA